MWGFLNEFFLWGAAAAVIPLLLHLLQKRRTVKTHFSTLRFLKLAQQRSASRIRLENLLLWLLRTLILIALALAFARPVLRTGALGSLLGAAQRDVAIVWDVSYSMTYDSGRSPVWDQARDTILDILSALDSGDRVCVFLAHEDVTPLIEQPTADLDLVRSLVKEQKPRPTVSRLQPTIAAALNALKDSGKREREVYIITDGQALPWHDVAAVETDEPVTYFIAFLGPTNPRNDAITALEIQPTTLLTNTPVRIQAKLLHSGEGAETSVSLFVDDQEVGRRSALDQVDFTIPNLERGRHTARLETPADGVMLDNPFYFLLQVRDQIPVLLIGAESDVFFLSRALNPRGDQAWRVTRIDPGAPLPPALHEFPAIFLCNALPLPGQLVLDLESYVRAGGVLTIFPGDNAAPGDYASWNSLPAQPTAIEDLTPQRFALRLDQPNDLLFRSIKLPSGTIPSVTIRRILRFDSAGRVEGDVSSSPSTNETAIATNTTAAARSILSVGESPFLLSCDFGEGRVLLLSVSADRRWSDLPLSAFFLPLVHQAVQLRTGTGEQPWRWTAAELAVPYSDQSLVAPSGETIPIRALKTETGTSHFLDNVVEPGIYRRGEEAVLAINIPRQESDLSPLARAALPLTDAHLAYDREELARLVEQHRIGRPFTEPLIWLILILALVELFVANRSSRPRTSISDSLRLTPAGRVLDKAA